MMTARMREWKTEKIRIHTEQNRTKGGREKREKERSPTIVPIVGRDGRGGKETILTNEETEEMLKVTKIKMDEGIERKGKEREKRAKTKTETETDEIGRDRARALNDAEEIKQAATDLT